MFSFLIWHRFGQPSYPMHVDLLLTCVLRVDWWLSTLICLFNVGILFYFLLRERGGNTWASIEGRVFVWGKKNLTSGEKRWMIGNVTGLGRRTNWTLKALVFLGHVIERIENNITEMFVSDFFCFARSKSLNWIIIHDLDIVDAKRWFQNLIITSTIVANCFSGNLWLKQEY